MATVTRYYVADNTAPKGFVELTETEWLALMGDETTRPYATNVYRGEMPIDEVPAELQETVQAVVDTKIARFGLYSERRISADEALNIITGGADA